MAFRGHNIGDQMRIGHDPATGECGTQYRLTNKSGSASVKGYVCEPSSTTDKAFTNIGAEGDPDPIGIVYEAGVADGSECWVWICGSMCEVYYTASTTHGQFARTGASSDSVTAIGQAISEAVPSPPFSSDKHFQEIGHVMASRTGAGLALTIIHFN